jgi:hypothetical protein
LAKERAADWLNVAIFKVENPVPRTSLNASYLPGVCGTVLHHNEFFSLLITLHQPSAKKLIDL